MLIFSTKYCLAMYIKFKGLSGFRYHVLQGKKVFFLIPPIDDNLKLYETWIKKGKQVKG
jgi:hypothetical protein